MRTLFTCFVLAAAAATVSVGSGPAPAQDKTKKADPKADPKVDPKADPKAKADPVKGGAVIEINEGKDGKYRFTVRDADGKYLGGNTVGHATKEDAAKTVEALRAALAGAKIEYGKKDEKK